MFVCERECLCASVSVCVCVSVCARSCVFSCVSLSMCVCECECVCVCECECVDSPACGRAASIHHLCSYQLAAICHIGAGVVTVVEFARGHTTRHTLTNL